jgi:hypothetical protein
MLVFFRARHRPEMSNRACHFAPFVVGASRCDEKIPHDEKIPAAGGREQEILPFLVADQK